MSQTSIIFGAFLLAFLIYITMQGKLATYIGFFFGSSSGTTP